MLYSPSQRLTHLLHSCIQWPLQNKHPIQDNSCHYFTCKMLIVQKNEVIGYSCDYIIEIGSSCIKGKTCLVPFTHVHTGHLCFHLGLMPVVISTWLTDESAEWGTLKPSMLLSAHWSHHLVWPHTVTVTQQWHTRSHTHTLTHSHTHTMLLLILAVIPPFSTTAQLVVWKWFHQFPSVWLAWLLQGKRTAANKGATVISLCEVSSTVVEEITTKRIPFCLPWFAMKKCAPQDIHKYMHSVLGWESDPNKQWGLSVDKAVNPSLPLGHDTWYKLWIWTWTTCKNSALSAWMPCRQCIPIRHLIN